MINIPAVLVANGSGIMLLLMLLINSKKAIQNRLPDSKLFFCMVYLAMAQCIIETGTFLIDGQHFAGAREISIVLNSILFMNNILFALTWALYTDYKLFGSMKRILKVYRFVGIPAFLVVAFGFVNMFTPIFFRVTENNIYERSGLFIFPYMITYFYLAYGAVKVYTNRNKNNRYLFLPVVLFLVPILIVSVLQFFFYGYSLLWIGSAIALTSIYINIQNKVSYIDALSGVFTRQYLNRFLESEIRRPMQKNAVAGIMLDIDRFKSINDEYGHLTGDDAIRFSGEILRSCTPPNSFVARFAGDEFVIITRVTEAAELEKLMDTIKQATINFSQNEDKPYHINFSMGYSIFNQNNDTVDSFLNRMDKEMYANKQSRR